MTFPAASEPRREPLRPFLKWAGGKSQLLVQLAPLFPPRFERYLEPFLGSGAVFFHLRPGRALLNDANAELVNAWTCVRDRLDELEPLLEQHRRLHGKEHYYHVRDSEADCIDPVRRAARFLYLNKTCFNGLYRVNKSGRFNVPMGRYAKPAIPSTADLEPASAALAGVRISSEPFAEFCRGNAGPGDFVYFDPPYEPLDKTANFTSYTAVGFGAQDQESLRDLFGDLDARGCLLMLSNSDTPLTRDLYARWAKTTVTVSARRAINSAALKRGHVSELVVMNYAPPSRPGDAGTN